MAKIPYIVFTIILLAIYYPWFTGGHIIGGDWPFYYTESVADFTAIPPSWSTTHGNGLGGEIVVYPLTLYVYLIGWLFVNTLSIPWVIVGKVFFYILYLILAIVGSMKLVQRFGRSVNGWQKCIAALIFTTNTYILMVVGGGQMGVALAYAITPFVLTTFIDLTSRLSHAKKSDRHKDSILFSFTYTAQIIFDARFAYISGIILALYLVVKVASGQIKIVDSIKYPSMAGIYVLLLNAFWLLPIFTSQNLPVALEQTQTSSAEAFKFFSFAELHHTFSLLHPNWPDNVFGKSYLMRFEFLVIPLVAFVGFLFTKKNYQIHRIRIMYLIIIGIFGAFLSKGAMEPFANINIWLYTNFPGFSLFRDATKFYVITALSYSVLIPLSLSSIKERQSSIYYLTFIAFWIILLFPIWHGELGGTFAYKTVPDEYVQLKDVLVKDDQFSRTLWVPRQQRFAFYENSHPAVEAQVLLEQETTASVSGMLQTDESRDLLEHLSVKYVVVPYDVNGDIFVTDRKYDHNKYLASIDDLDSIPWLSRLDQFEKIGVYKLDTFKDRVTLENGVINSINRQSSYSYQIDITTNGSDMLLFNEKYGTNWRAAIDGKVIPMRESVFGTIAIPIDSEGAHDISLMYQSEKYYSIGRYISGIALLMGMLKFFRSLIA